MPTVPIRSTSRRWVGQPPGARVIHQEQAAGVRRRIGDRFGLSAIDQEGEGADDVPRHLDDSDPAARTHGGSAWRLRAHERDLAPHRLRDDDLTEEGL